MPLLPTSNTYCLCYNPVKTQDNSNLGASTNFIILRNSPTKAARFTIEPSVSMSGSPNIVSIHPRSQTVGLDFSEFIRVTFDKAVFISSVPDTVLTVTIASYLMDESCFGTRP